jgi:uncharacterized protein
METPVHDYADLPVYAEPPAGKPADGERSMDRRSLPQLVATTNLDLDVTDSCNLGCLYCFKNELKGPTMKLETAKKSVEWLLEASGSAVSVNVNFMGGEPTLAWNLISTLVPWARRRGRACGKLVTFSMTSNLTLWTDEIRRFIDDYGFGILMSIDGCPEVQDAQRPAKNGRQTSDTVSKWARSLLTTRPMSQARMTLHPKFVHRFEESVQYIHSLGFREIAVASAAYGEWSPDTFNELRVQLGRVVDYLIRSYESPRPLALSVMKYYVGRLIHPRRQSQAILESKQPCGAGKGYLMIDRTGDIWPCHRFDGADEDAGTNGRFRMGNIFKAGFNHDLQRSFLDFDHMKQHKDRCNTCPVNPICGGFCPAANVSETGSIYTPHDAFCDWTQEMYAASEVLYEKLYLSHPRAFKTMLDDALTTTSDGQR